VTTTLAAEVEDWPHPDEMEFEEIQFDIKEADKYELQNGLTVYLLENKSLPLIKGQAYIGTGNVYSPENKVGLAEMTAELMRTGGAAGTDPEVINEKLESMAASIEFSAQNTYTTANFNTLSDNIQETINLFDDILRKPDFLSERIEISRKKMKENIRRRNDQPVQIAVREFIKKIAEGHPAGRFPTLETVDSIQREDLINFHNKYYQPQEITMAITGDFEKDNMIDLLENTLGKWEGQEVDYPELPEFNKNPEPKVYHVQKPFQQSIILLGSPAVTFNDDSFAALNLGNRILGGTGDSRLFKQIRSERGLAYSVGSQLTQGFDYPGYFYSYAISQAAQTGTVIDLILEEINKLKKDPVTEKELTKHREAILNQAVFRYTSARQIAGRQAMDDFLDLEPDYYEKYIEQIQNLDRNTLKDYIDKEFDPEQFIILVVGNSNTFEKSLDEFGEVKNIELEIN
ncbi:MAG: M16 family metallopeptidase, partial [Bacillota bacterium]